MKTEWMRVSQADRSSTKPKYSVRDLAERFSMSEQDMEQLCADPTFPKPAAFTKRFNTYLPRTNLYHLDDVSKWLTDQHRRKS